MLLVLRAHARRRRNVECLEQVELTHQPDTEETYGVYSDYAQDRSDERLETTGAWTAPTAAGHFSGAVAAISIGGLSSIRSSRIHQEDRNRS